VGLAPQRASRTVWSAWRDLGDAGRILGNVAWDGLAALVRLGVLNVALLAVAVYFWHGWVYYRKALLIGLVAGLLLGYSLALFAVFQCWW
jgi:hypothetical protein